MIRRAFIAGNNAKIVSADYSQIELRIMAHISGDKGLKQAFANNLDIHSATASEVFGVAFAEVTANQRRSAKAINFGLLYGMSAYGLARQLGIEPRQANNYIERYFERYPGVRRYMDSVRAQAAETGYVETMFGRRLYVPDIHSNNSQRQRAAERAAINAPMQGSAADIIKRAMIDIDHWIVNSDLAIKMVMQVHDELIFEVDQQDIDVACQIIPKLMSQAATLNVPLLADIGVGDSWAEAH
jgi:DNA polymerase-1